MSKQLDRVVQSASKEEYMANANQFIKLVEPFDKAEVIKAISGKLETTAGGANETIMLALELISKLMDDTDFLVPLSQESFLNNLVNLTMTEEIGDDARHRAYAILERLATNKDLVQLAEIYQITIFAEVYNQLKPPKHLEDPSVYFEKPKPV